MLELIFATGYPEYVFVTANKKCMNMSNISSTSPGIYLDCMGFHHHSTRNQGQSLVHKLVTSSHGCNAVFSHRSLFLNHMADLEDPVWKGYMFAGILCGVTIIRTLVHQLALHIGYRTGMHVRSAFVGAVFRKVSECPSMGFGFDIDYTS